jgi:hypothetical protein
LDIPVLWDGKMRGLGTYAAAASRAWEADGKAAATKMAKADQFRQYAEEAMRWAFQSKTEKEKQAYIDLAHTWTQAAVHSEHIFGVNDSPPEVKLGL